MEGGSGFPETEHNSEALTGHRTVAKAHACCDFSSLSACTILNYFSPPSPYRPSWLQLGDYWLWAVWCLFCFFLARRRTNPRKSQLELDLHRCQGDASFIARIPRASQSELVKTGAEIFQVTSYLWGAVCNMVLKKERLLETVGTEHTA